MGASPSLLLKLAAAGALSLAVVELVPRSADSSGSQPPVRTLLVTVAENDAAPAERLTLALAFTAVFGASFATLAANPDQVLVGYKG